jgi:hypothetical protein
MAAICMTATAVPDEYQARPNEVPGWGRVLDPWRDCNVALDREHDRLTIKVPGTLHVLSAEVPQLPMNAPRVVRRVRGDFTAGVQVSSSHRLVSAIRSFKASALEYRATRSNPESMSGKPGSSRW